MIQNFKKQFYMDSCKDSHLRRWGGNCIAYFIHITEIWHTLSYKKCSPIYTMNCSYNVCFMSQCSCKLILLLSQDGSYKQVQINYKKKTRNIRFCYEGSNSWKSRCIWVLNSILAHAQMTRPYPQWSKSLPARNRI